MLSFVIALAFCLPVVTEAAEQCEDEHCISHTGFLQQGIRLKKSLCDRIQMPQLPDEGSFRHMPRDSGDAFVYVLAVTNDSATNPYSYRYAERRNFRERWTPYGFISYWQSSPDADWEVHNRQGGSGDPHETTWESAVQSACGEWGCHSSMWHVNMWKGHRFWLNFCCWPDLVGNEVFYEGGPVDSELVAYAWELIKAKGGGMEKYPLVELPAGPTKKSCPGWKPE